MSQLAAGRSGPLRLLSHGDNDVADGPRKLFDEVANS